jgi:serine/threonine protein kinase, bacterial
MDTLRITAVVALASLAACSGGGSPSFAPVAPIAGSSAAPSSNARATLTIVVPQASGTTSTTASTRRMPRYVSPASANLQVAVNGGTATSYGLTPSSPGCATQAGNLTCTFAIAAPTGADTMALTLTDGAGNVLSRNVVTATVAADVATPINVTLAGVPASVIVVPGANAIVDTKTPPYHAPGLAPQPVEVEALDADGNVIIGPGAPTVGNVTVTTGGTYASIAPAPGTDPAAFLLTPVDGSAGGQTVGVSATVQGIPLSDGTTAPPLTNTTAYTFTPAIAIASGPAVYIYSLESSRQLAAFSACMGGCPLTIASGATSDAKGNLYIDIFTSLGLSQANTIVVFPHGRTSASYALGSAAGVHRMGGLTIDPQGNLWVSESASGGFRQPYYPPAILEFAPGAKTPTYTITGTTATPGGIAVDAAGNIYESDMAGTKTIVKYPPNSQTSSGTLSDPSLALPNALVIDAAGGLYAVDQTNKHIVYFAAGATTVTKTLNESAFSQNGVFALMMDPGGNLWASLGATGRVEQYAASALPNSLAITNSVNTAGAMAWIP